MSCGGGCGGGCSTCSGGSAGGSSGGILPPAMGCRTGLAQRLAPTVDRLRQRLTTAGLRVYDVWLVWTAWSGAERGVGSERELARVKLFPNPEVVDLTSVTLSPFSAGLLPVGSIRLNEISTRLTLDDLKGRTIPGKSYFDGCKIIGMPGGMSVGQFARTEAQQIGHHILQPGGSVPEPFEFFYEVVQNTVANAPRQKFRLLSEPFLRPGKFDWSLVLERISEDRGRRGESRIGPDHSED